MDDKLYEAYFALLAIAPKCEECMEQVATRSYTFRNSGKRRVCDSPYCLSTEHRCSKCGGRDSGNESGPLSATNPCSLCGGKVSSTVTVAQDVRDLPHAKVLREARSALYR
jgi:hypothetical protein